MIKIKGNTVISKQRLFELSLVQEKMYRLEAGGVDNWEWYYDSLNPPEIDETSLEQFEEDLKRYIEEMPEPHEVIKN